MFLLEPDRTPWDLHFDVAGIPVRVHPFHWVISLILVLMMGFQGIAIVLGVGVIFLSILIHELGHAFTMRAYGERPRVILYSFGGLAISGGDDPWNAGFRQKRRTPMEQIIISAAGPGAGFILAAIVILLVSAAGGTVSASMYYIFPIVFAILSPEKFSPAAQATINVLLWVNVYWGVLNLLPVYPLDGGQISRQVFLMANPYDGLRQSLWVSLFVGGAMAVLGITTGSLWLTFLFASLAYGSWEALQGMGGYGGPRW